MIVVRRAVPGDAEQLASIAESTFRATFASANTQADIDLHCSRSYSAKTQLREIESADTVTLVAADDDDSFAGYAQLRWRSTPSCVHDKDAGEIHRLYVASEWHGRGLAQELMAACIAEALRRKSQHVWLGVWERNPRAIAFYRKLGFVGIGEHIFQLGSDQQRDIIMLRPVTLA